MIAVLVLIAAILLITAVALAWPRHPRQHGPPLGAVNLDVTQELWPVVRHGHPPWPDVPAPLNVPGRDTPASAELSATPPADAGGKADVVFPAGGSTVPAREGTVPGETGTPQSPGAGCLPEGDAPMTPRPPQEAPAPGDLPPDLLNWLTVQAIKAHMVAELREVKWPGTMPGGAS